MNKLNGDALVIKKWVVSTLIVIVMAIAGQTVTAVWWAASVDLRLDAREEWRQEFKNDMEEVKANSATALNVLRDHGVEFQEQRQRTLLVETNVSALRTEVAERTKDRFTRNDWLAEKESILSMREQNVKHYDFQLSELTRRVTIIEEILRNERK